MNVKTTKKVTINEFYQEAVRLFGPNTDDWKFVCPVCGHVASVSDYQESLVSEYDIGFLCIGPCMEKIAASNPVEIVGFGRYFDFFRPVV